MVLDSLQILIEADAHGLTSQLTRASDTIKNFVSQMNNQEVNWQSIFTKTVSPAIITGVASTFALALTHMLEFSNTVAETGQQTGDNFNNNSAQITKEATNLSNTFGVSRNDIASAMGYISKSFSDSATQQIIASKASAIAATGLMSVTDAAKLLSDVLVAWNINTAPQASAALDRLWNDSKNSKLSFQDFTDELIKNSAALRNNTSFADASASLRSLSNDSKMTQDSTKNMFDAIASGAANAYSDINVMNGGIGSIKKMIKEGGVEQAVKDVITNLQKWGPLAPQIGEQWGLSLTSVNNLMDMTNKDLLEIQANTQKILQTKPPTVEVSVEANMSSIQKLKVFFNVVANSISDAFKTIFSKAIDDITQIMKDPAKGIPSSVSDVLSILSPLVNPVTNPIAFAGNFVGNEAAKLFGGNSSQPTPSAAGAVTPNSSVTFNNTYNMSVPQGGQNVIPQNISKEQYNMLYGYNPSAVPLR